MERILKKTKVKKGLFGKIEAALTCTETTVIIEDSKLLLGIIPLSSTHHTIPVKSISNCSIGTENPIKASIFVTILSFIVGLLTSNGDLIMAFALLGIALGVFLFMQKKCTLTISDNGGSKYEVKANYTDFFEVSNIVDIINRAIQGDFEIIEYAVD